MKYQIIPVTSFQQNCNLIWCEETKDAAVIDPGGDLDRILEAISVQGVNLKFILLTHGHIDHAGGAKKLSESCGVDIIGPHEADQFWLDNLHVQSEHYGFPDGQSFTPTRYLNDGDLIQLGEQSLKVIHCPGHTPGHVVFYSEQAHLAWCGDVLFRGAIGRTDFPQSDYQQLIDSIRLKLFPLGEVDFIPGHGPNSSFSLERKQNPFVADKLFEK